MVSWAELAAWTARTAFISILFSSLNIKILVMPLGNGIIRNDLSRNILYIACALFLNLIYSGKPKFLLDKNGQNIRGKEYYLSSGVLSTLFFLMQGLKVKEVERNLVVLSGLKKVSLCPYGSRLRIENKEPIKKVDYITTIIVILIALVILIISPMAFIELNSYISKILSSMGLPGNFSENLIMIFGMVVLTFYLSPYSIMPWNWQYKASVITTFRKRIENIHSDFIIYVCPMMPFLERRFPLGLAHKNEIYINPLIAENNAILQYIVAHEEGHIRDPYAKIKFLLSPLLFPWTAFIVISSIAYLYFTDKLPLWKVVLIGIAVFSLILLIFRKIKQIQEERAEDYAIKKIGIDNVIRALRELAYGDNALPEYCQNRYRSLIVKHIERLKERHN